MRTTLSILVAYSSKLSAGRQKGRWGAWFSQCTVSGPDRSGQTAHKRGGGDGGQKEKEEGAGLVQERQSHPEEGDRAAERLRYHHR